MSRRPPPSGAAYARDSGTIPPGAVDQPRPGWMQRLVTRLGMVDGDYFSRFLPPDDDTGRESAVLMLFGPPPVGSAATGEHVLLIERSHTMRSHPAQIAFPGGAREPTDRDAVETALREAHEETGLDPAGVEVVSVLPSLFLPPSQFVVAPVIAWWRHPTPVGIVDEAEVHDVIEVPLQHLVDPGCRYSVRHPSGFTGPAFDIDQLVLWGFTAGLLSRTLELAGLDHAWDQQVLRPLPERYLGGRRG
ncbi:CoA pyrophosphatase [Intrasporangium sp.]|uniref:NUDIX hydrolase n=1 Tax=Intrasporangium sp. TaxID=1925024 RepID=UPI0032221F9C